MEVERIQALLTKRGISSELKMDGTELMTMIFTGPVGSRLLLREQHGVLSCLIMIPLACPEYRRTEMAVAMNLANWGLIGGSFRMDVADGELRYECYLPARGAEITDAQLDWLILGSWSTTGRYAMALMEVALSAAQPDEAIARAEASWKEEERQSLPVH